MSSRHPVLLLLASTRIANLPSVVCNVWLGVAMGVFFCPPMQSCWPAALLLALSGSLLYVGGNFLNDWHDRHWDARHRPERALPLGAFTPALYLGCAVLCTMAGVALAGFTSAASGGVAAVIVLCIVIYTRWHKQAAWTVLVMGLCRGLLPLLFFIEWPLRGIGSGTCPGGLFPALVLISTAALALMLYVAALSKIARSESLVPPPATGRLADRGLLVLSGLSMAGPFLCRHPMSDVLGLLPFALWLGLCFTRGHRPVPAQIAALLAGLPLLDWVLLLPLSLRMWGTPGPPGHLPIALTCLLLPPLAFLSGRLLQRLAAAT
jgi:hypothetical protein